MTIDEKYRNLCQIAADIQDHLVTKNPPVARLIGEFCGKQGSNLNDDIQSALRSRADAETKILLDGLNTAYMELVVGFRSSFARSELGKAVSLIAPFAAIVELFLDEKGDWR